MAIVIGDIHLGRGNKSKNSIYYNKFFEAFSNMINSMVNYQRELGGDFHDLIIAGDLFEKVSPSPDEYKKCQQILRNYIYQTQRHVIIIPGNHDYVLKRQLWDGSIESASASQVIQFENKIISCDDENKTHELLDENILLVPYSENMFQKIEAYNGPCEILISHFTTNQMSPYAGKIDETNPMFDKFDKIILGDYHKIYDSGKFITAGCSYFRDVDEMIGNIPSFIVVSDENIERITFENRAIKEINSFDEYDNISENEIYFIKLTEEMQADTLRPKHPNVFEKHLKSKKSVLTEETIEIGNCVTGTNIPEIIGMYLHEIENVEDLDEDTKTRCSKILMGEISLDNIIDMY